MSSGELAEKYGCTRTTVCRHLKRLGITKPLSGANSRNRKRNGEVIKTGYPVSHLPTHPRSSAIGYVFKHVLEMEKHIGRTPKRSEPVHHIDTDRMNYSIDNLFLCKNNSHHQQLHISLSSVVRQLIKDGTIKFKNGQYVL